MIGRFVVCPEGFGGSIERCLAMSSFSRCFTVHVSDSTSSGNELLLFVKTDGVGEISFARSH